MSGGAQAAIIVALWIGAFVPVMVGLHLDEQSDTAAWIGVVFFVAAYLLVTRVLNRAIVALRRGEP